MSAPADLEAIVRNVIVGSPLGRLLGVEPVSVTRDRVVVRLPFRSELTTVGDLVHGGAIGALADVTATAVAWSGVDLGRGPRGTTVGLTINYLNGACRCDLVATGAILQRGKSIVVCEVGIADGKGMPIARALVTYKLGYRDGESG
jgi:uncharacterized protein (TIGR00369 family)